MEFFINRIMDKMAQAQLAKQEFKQIGQSEMISKDEKEDRLYRIRKCECGFDPHCRDVSHCDRHSRCNVQTGLTNHIAYPSVYFLSEYDDPSMLYFKVTDAFRPRRHWAAILEIRHDISLVRPGVIGFNQFGEELAAHFYHDKDKEPKTFSWSDLKPGNTLAILYAEKVFIDGSLGIKEDNLNSCYIFLAPIKFVQQEARHLLYCADARFRNEPERCFKCGVVSNTLSQCSDCKLAKYCSKECQTEAWKSHHRNLCKQIETLFRFACIQRYGFDEAFSFADDRLPQYKPAPISNNSKRNNKRKNKASASSYNLSSNE